MKRETGMLASAAIDLICILLTFNIVFTQNLMLGLGSKLWKWVGVKRVQEWNIGIVDYNLLITSRES